MTNTYHNVLYTGVTSDLPRRGFEHRNKLVKGFTAKYNCDILVYYEVLEDMETALAREKQIKAGSRAKKLKLIDSFNGSWRDPGESL